MARATTQQAAVQQALVGDGFRSAQDVYAALRDAGQKIGLSTVYRHLQAFADQGLADVVQHPDGEAAYRLCGHGTGDQHHHHLICRRCGHAEEIEGRAVERWASETARTHGYTQVDHTIEIFGLCRDCSGTAPDAADDEADEGDEVAEVGSEVSSAR